MGKARGVFCFVAGVFLILSVFPAFSRASGPSTPPVDFLRPLSAESAFASPVVFPEQFSKGSPEKYKEGELLVKFKQGVSKSKEQNLHEKHGSNKLKEFKKIRVHLVKIKKGLSVEEAIKKYKSDPSVEYAEPNFVVSINALPNDLHFGELWGLHNTGQSGGTPDADIDAPEAWGICTGNPSLVVAVIDTGIDYNHEDLTANMWTNPAEAAGDANGDGYPGLAGVDDDSDGLIDEDAQDNSRFLPDGVTPNPAWFNDLINDDDENGYGDDIHGIDTCNRDSDPADDHGHGTHCAGTIGADGNNGIGVAGVNWDIQVLACKFLGGGGSGYTDDAVTCLEYISDLKDRGINVVATSNSWGCEGSYCYSQALYDAIQEQMQKDILFIAAASNSGVDNDSYDFYPSDYKLPNIIAVAATDRNDNRAIFSNYGRRSVHVAAPGVDIVSLRAAGTDMSGDGQHFIPAGDPGAAYYRASGTSMAAPHVAGLAGLVQSQNPGFDWREIKNLILAGGDTIASLEPKTITGRRINAYGSLTCVHSPVFSILEYPSELEVGVPVTLSALSINCGLPVGPVTVTLTGNEIVTLADDGIAPDIAAGDGLFTATLTPVRNIDRLTFSSPAGEESVLLPPLVIYTYLSEGNTAYFYNHILEAKGGLAPYTWAITAGSLPDGLALDNATGEISGTPATSGNSTFSLQVTDSLNSTLARDVAISVSDHSVVESWGKSYDNGGADYASGIARAPGGNLYVTGTIQNGTDWDCLLRKYDSDGVLAWSRTYDSGQRNSCSDVAVDGAENIYLSGLSGVDMPSEDFLLVKYDASGNFIWAKTYDPVSTGRFTDSGWHGGRAQGIAFDGSGNIYLTGYWGGSIVDVGFRFSTLTVKYQPSGDIEWVRLHVPTMAGDGALGYGITLDSGGNVYVAGERQYYHEENGVGSHNRDVLFIKYDAAGNEIWARVYDHPKQSGGTCAGDRANDVAVDQSDNLYVTGYTCDGYCYLMKYTPTGDLVWTVYNNDMNDAYGVDLDVNGDVLVTGALYKGSGDYDFRTIKYDAGGNVKWERRSSPETEIAYAITADNNANFYLAGTYANDTDTDWLIIKYHDALQLTTSSLASSETGIFYSQVLTAEGGKKPYTWAVASGSLPDGLTLDSGSGVISGTPAVAGTANFSVQVADANFEIVTKPLAIMIYSKPVITTSYLLTGITNRPYSTNLTATEGTPPYVWSVVSGSLPAGLALNAASGDISGSPTIAGTFHFSVQVTDSMLLTDTQTLSVTLVNGVPTIIASSFDLGVSTPCSHSLTVEGGTPPYVWSVVSGSLPPGLAIGPSTGVITGTATTPGTYFVTVQVTDAASVSSSEDLVITVTPVTVVEEWHRTSNGGGWEQANGMTLDADGNLYVIGVTYTALTGSDYFTVKRDAAGNELWARIYTEVGLDAYGQDVAVDNAGNVYVVGYSTANGAEGTANWLIVKYDSAGSVVWTRPYDGGYGDQALAVETDSAGNIYVAGKSFLLVAGYWGYYMVIVKYDPAGNIIWTKTGELGEAQDIALDDAGNIYLTGYKGNSQIITGKYDGSGNEVWTRTYSSGTNSVFAYGVGVDGDGNVYVGGRRTKTAGNDDVLTVKYDAAGNEVWVRTYDSGDWDGAYDLAVDRSDNIYLTGYSYNSTRKEDYLTVKYDSAGNLIWSKSFDGNNGPDIAIGIAVDESGNIFVAGYSAINGSQRDYLTIKYSQDNSQDFRVATADLPDGLLNVFYSRILEAAGGMGPYTWAVVAGDLPPGLTLNSATGEISGTPTASGNYDFTVEATDSNQDPVSRPLFLAVNEPRTLEVTVSGSGIVAGIPAGIMCPGDCSELHAGGATVTLLATPLAGWEFFGWSGGGCSGTGSCIVTMNGDTTVRAFFAIPGAPPTAGFSGAPLNGAAPFIVDFVDTSTNIPTSWAWDFGDGSTSTAQNPMHIFEQAGSYTVVLTVSNGNGPDVMTMVDYITVGSCANDPVQVGGVFYNTIGEAYSDLLTVSGDVIQAHGLLIDYDLVLDRDIDVTIAGGNNCEYTASAMGSKLSGSLIISDGTVTIENLIIM